MNETQGSAEAMHPLVRSILDSVVIEDDGTAFVDDYVQWIMQLRKIPARSEPRLFVQLAVLARQYFDAGCRPVAMSLAALSRIGLNRLVQE